MFANVFSRNYIGLVCYPRNFTFIDHRGSQLAGMEDVLLREIGMQIFKYSLILSALAWGTSCTGGGKNKADGHVSYVLENTGIKTFVLDSLTGPISTFVTYVQAPDADLFCMYSREQNALVFFDYASGMPVDKAQFSNEGPNGVGGYSGYKGFQVISRDSILVANVILNKVFLLNSKGEILDQMKVYTDPLNQDTLIGGLDVGVNRPLVLKNNEVYMHTLISGRALKDHTKFSHVMIAGFADGTVRRSMYRPEVYNRGYWSANGEFDRCYSTYNPDTKRFIYSFPVDHHLYETDHQEHFVPHPAASEYIEDIKPMSSDRMAVQDWQKSVEYDYTNSRYYQVIYDRFNGLYYRFALLGNTLDEVKDPDVQYKQRAAVILLDNDFHKVGKIVLDRGRNLFHNFFIGKEGLHIQVDPVLYDNEDDLVYDVYRPVKK
ncbi:DUF4221 family protein [Negadavirga shengliensis]|uniref:DUF4221 family protein n=1 Tax=Negadavirga shengliensis TaxID=1389218 RepID=A0ABV9T6E5_9BACT